jgi:hypothetical protein
LSEKSDRSDSEPERSDSESREKPGMTRSRSPNKRGDPPKCSHCTGLGHIESNCWFKHPNLAPSEWAPRVRGKNEDLQPRVSNSSHATPNDWMVDSCASFHMTADRSAFASYRPLNHRESVEAVFGHQKRPSGIGTVILQVEGGELVLQDVRHIPHLTTKSNIISLGRLVREGYPPTLDKQFTFSSPDGREFRAELANDVYRILSCKAASVSII